MDNWLKALIAVACVVVIFGGGYLGWKEYAAANQKPAISQHEIDRQACRISLTKAGSELQSLRDKCLNEKHITQEEYYRANSGDFPE